MVYAPLILEQSDPIISETRKMELITTEREVFSILSERVEVLDILQESKIGEGIKKIWEAIKKAVRWLIDKVKELIGKIKAFFKRKKDANAEKNIKEGTDELKKNEAEYAKNYASDKSTNESADILNEEESIINGRATGAGLKDNKFYPMYKRLRDNAQVSMFDASILLPSSCGNFNNVLNTLKYNINDVKRYTRAREKEKPEYTESGKRLSSPNSMMANVEANREKYLSDVYDAIFVRDFIEKTTGKKFAQTKEGINDLISVNLASVVKEYIAKETFNVNNAYGAYKNSADKQNLVLKTLGENQKFLNDLYGLLDDVNLDSAKDTAPFKALVEKINFCIKACKYNVSCYNYVVQKSEQTVKFYEECFAKGGLAGKALKTMVQ